MKKSAAPSKFLYIGTIIVAVLIGAALIIIQVQRTAAIDAFRTATNNLGDGMSRQTAGFFASTDAVLKQVGARLGVAHADRAGDIKAIIRSHAAFDLLADQQGRMANVAKLFVVSADGELAASSEGWPVVEANAARTDYFIHFKTTDDHAAFIGEPIRDPSSDAWVIPIVRRLDDRHGQFAGVVAADISVKDLEGFYEVAMPSRRAVYVARRDGMVLFRYPDRQGEIGRRIPAQSSWYTVVAHGGGDYDAPAYFDGRKVIASVRLLGDLPLVVETSVDEAIALSEWDKQKLWLILGCIFLIVESLGLLYLFAKQYRRIELSELCLAKKNEELDLTSRQLEVTLANLSQGVCFFDNDKTLLVYNQRYCELMGLPSSMIRPGMSLREIAERRIAAGTFQNGTIDAYMASIDALLRDGKPRAEISELADGRTLAKHFQPLPGYGWVMTQEDISERRAAELKISFLAHHDLLTGLANRALFQDRLVQALTQARRGRMSALLCLDLDRFKAVNDTYGHSIGDGLLRAVADRLKAVVRDGDTIARLGGDEFVILQTYVADTAETGVLAMRIVEAINAPFDIDGTALDIGVSVGIAMTPDDSTDPDRLMQYADRALYRSKREGRGTWRFFDPAIDMDTNAILCDGQSKPVLQ